MGAGVTEVLMSQQPFILSQRNRALSFIDSLGAENRRDIEQIHKLSIQKKKLEMNRLREEREETEKQQQIDRTERRRVKRLRKRNVLISGIMQKVTKVLDENKKAVQQSAPSVLLRKNILNFEDLFLNKEFYVGEVFDLFHQCVFFSEELHLDQEQVDLLIESLQKEIHEKIEVSVDPEFIDFLNLQEEGCSKNPDHVVPLEDLQNIVRNSIAQSSFEQFLIEGQLLNADSLQLWLERLFLWKISQVKAQLLS